MAGTRSKPSDFTGRQREEAQAAQAERLAENQARMSMATAKAVQKLETEVIDLSDASNPVAIEEVEVVLAEAQAVIRVNEDLNTTYGAGNNYVLKVGQRYKVPQDLADLLEEKGYLWH